MYENKNMYNKKFDQGEIEINVKIRTYSVV